MLSKKMAFSLTSLITLFALAFAVTPVMAVGEFSVTIDGPTAVTYEEGQTTDVMVDLIIETGQPIPMLVGAVPTPASPPDPDPNNVVVTFFDADDNVISTLSGTNSITDLPKDDATNADPPVEYPMRTAQMRKITSHSWIR